MSLRGLKIFSAATAVSVLLSCFSAVAIAQESNDIDMHGASGI